MPPIIEADMEAAAPRYVAPAEWFNVILAMPTYGRSAAKEGGLGNNPMITIPYVDIDKLGTEHHGKRVFVGYNIMAGGKGKTGDAMNLNQLCVMLDALAAQGVDWECKNCGQAGPSRFKRGAKGTKDAGKFFCPNCNEQSTFKFNTDHWQGKRVNMLFRIGKFLNSDDDRNEVARVLPVGEATNLPAAA